MVKEFAVIYDWDYEKAVHYFDTFEEALKDRNKYGTDPSSFPIFQLVKEVKTTKFVFPNGREVEP